MPRIPARYMCPSDRSLISRSAKITEEALDALVVPMLRAARIPGLGIAVTAGDKLIVAKGYGFRDIHAKLPLTADTVYPIASTAKAMNATLLGILVDEGQLEWDAPVQRYLPRFRLHDQSISHLVTVKDLLTMRTGLPGHDLVWLENPLTRADLVERIAHLPLSTGFRERFQYNDLTVTVAGHVAEVITGESWEALVRKRILVPLGMCNTGFELPAAGNVTRFYHENRHRKLVPTRNLLVEPIGPAGGSIYSTVSDMARWVALNLNGGKSAVQQLIESATLAALHSPSVIMDPDPAAPSRGAAYGLGWFVDTYNGRTRVSHTGWLHDVNSCVTLFPESSIGIVCFSNFASARIASFVNECVFDLIMGLKPVQTIDEVLDRYELKIENTRKRYASLHRVPKTKPSHALPEYTGNYEHPGYGNIEIALDRARKLTLRRNSLVLTLSHWNYDTWVAQDNDLFEIHKPQPFDRIAPLVFETSADGQIKAVSTQLEASVEPIRFRKRDKVMSIRK